MADPPDQVSRCGARAAVNNTQRLALVQEQIQLRLRVLEAWLDKGAPDGQRVPASLNQVRKWDNPSLGIVPIGSSATFTTTHRAHGAFVASISEVLRDLAAQRSPRSAGKKKSAAQRRAQLASHKRMLVAAASQYAAISVQLHEATLGLRVAKQSLDACRSENRRLRSELRRRSSPGTVTDLDSRRPGGVPGDGC